MQVRCKAWKLQMEKSQYNDIHLLHIPTPFSGLLIKISPGIRILSKILTFVQQEHRRRDIQRDFIRSCVAKND